MSGPCLSSSVADRPLRPATRRRLGEPLPHQQADRPRAHPEATAEAIFGPETTCGINLPFGRLSPTSGQVAHVLRTRPPLELQLASYPEFSFDLHVLSTPPAFVLSQNQTLRRNFDWLIAVVSKQIAKIDLSQFHRSGSMTPHVVRTTCSAQFNLIFSSGIADDIWQETCFLSDYRICTVKELPRGD